MRQRKGWGQGEFEEPGGLHGHPQARPSRPQVDALQQKDLVQWNTQPPTAGSLTVLNILQGLRFWGLWGCWLGSRVPALL